MRFIPLFSLIIPGLEPRASSSRTAAVGDGVPGRMLLQYAPWYTQGVHRVYIGWHTPGST